MIKIISLILFTLLFVGCWLSNSLEKQCNGGVMYYNLTYGWAPAFEENTTPTLILCKEVTVDEIH